MHSVHLSQKGAERQQFRVVEVLNATPTPHDQQRACQTVL